MNNKVELFFGSRPKFSVATVGEFSFSIVSLSDDVKELIGACESYAEMLTVAADNGLAFDRKRISEDEDRKLDIPLFWEDEDFYTDDDPTIKQQVGIAVCKLSDLAEAIGAQALKENPPVDDTTFDTELADQQVSEHPQSIN